MFSGDENSISFSSLQAKAGLNSILKKIRNQFYKSGNDPELKRYWMPDSNSRECYDCSEKFTTIRRKHHCRVCGQIFCNKCCKGDIPGNLIGYSSTTNLRACNYCYKIVTSLSKNNFLISSNTSLNVPKEYNTRSPSLQITPTNTSITSSKNIKEIFRIGEGSENLNTLLVSDLKKKVNTDEVTSKSSPLPRARTTSPIFTFERKSSIGFREEDYAKSSSLLSDGLNNKSPYALYQTNGSISASLYGSAANLACKNFQQRVSSSSQDATTIAPLWARDFNLTHESFDDKSSESYSSIEIENSNLRGNIESETVYDENGLISKTEQAQTPNVTLNKSGFEIELDLKNEQVSAFKSAKKETVPTFTFKIEPVNESKTASAYDEIDNDDNLLYTEPSILVNNPIMYLFDSSKVSKNLDDAFEKLVTKLLIQLLDKENLLHTWITPIKNLAQKVAHTVSPNCISEKDEMDIQQYVKIKKIPGGNKSDSMIVNGLVISKNVTHRKMNQNINNPKILLLSCPIVYHQRVGQKLTTLDSILLQEHNYLKNLVIKISTYNPDIVVVDKTFARTAKEILLDLGITLVCNVKSSVLEKIARFTGAEIVNSIEAQIGPPQLGHCEKFYVKCFNNSKTFMFFEGCPPEVGCTIVLRGSQSEVILKKVKYICYFVIYCYYNWRLERSLLIALYASPPSSRGGEAKYFSENELQNDMKAKSDNVKYAKDKPSGLKPSWTIIEDESDPLRLMASDAEKGPPTTPITSPSNITMPLSKSLSEDSLSKKVSQFLSNTVLVCSPFIEMDLPYFLSVEGSMCPLKRYFDIENSFWFERFKNDRSSKKKENLLEVEEATLSTRKMSQPVERIKHHSFITRDLKHNLGSTNTLDLLADFRARGSSYPKTRQIICNENIVSITDSEPIIDPLNERYHQRLPILYFSFSYSSALSPFCLNPWIVIMEFYGSRDISLGTFLEKYCFLPTYSCPATGCSAPMVEHIRKFVHGKAAIHISLKQLTNDMNSVETDIITWSVCQKCRTSSPISILSKNARSLSFAKFLELKLYGDKYSIRVPGISSECTQHSLFQDHIQYFAYKKIAASFKYQQITINEVTLPSPKIKLNSRTHSPSSSNMANETCSIDQTLLSAKPLTVSEKPAVALNENDFGSIIAYSLSTAEYEKQMNEITRASASPCTKKKLLASLESNGSSIPSDVKDSQFEVSIGSSGVSFNSKAPVSHCSNVPHINLQFSHATTEFHCCVYFADQFRKLRSELIILNNVINGASTSSLSQSSSNTSNLRRGE